MNATAESLAGATNEAAIQRYADDIEGYWRQNLTAQQMPTLIPVYRVEPYYLSTADERPLCNRAEVNSQFLIQNAFFCRIENVIHYDAEGLAADLRQNFGSLSLGILIAHEYGHAIQEQTVLLGSDLQNELQADCFAGAWTADYLSRQADLGEAPGSGELDTAVASLAAYADQPGAESLDGVRSHGTGEDRIASFLLGTDHGFLGCL